MGYSPLGNGFKYFAFAYVHCTDESGRSFHRSYETIQMNPALASIVLGEATLSTSGELVKLFMNNFMITLILYGLKFSRIWWCRKMKINKQVSVRILL